MVTDFQHGTHLCYPKSSFRTMFHCGRTERAGPGDTTIDEWYGNKQTQNQGDNNKQTNKQTPRKPLSSLLLRTLRGGQCDFNEILWCIRYKFYESFSIFIPL